MSTFIKNALVRVAASSRTLAALFELMSPVAGKLPLQRLGVKPRGFCDIAVKMILLAAGLVLSSAPMAHAQNTPTPAYTSDGDITHFTATINSYATFDDYSNSQGCGGDSPSTFTPTSTELASTGCRVFGGTLSITLGEITTGNWIRATFPNPVSTIVVFPNIDHFGSAYDGYQYKIAGSNDGTHWTLLFDALTVTGTGVEIQGEPFTLASSTGTAPTTVNNVRTPQSLGIDGTDLAHPLCTGVLTPVLTPCAIGYIATFNFPTAYKFYAFGASTAATNLGHTDQELSAVGTPSQSVLTFPMGDNVSASATFNCPSGLTPCPDADAHSIKFTVGHVSSQFTVVVTATEFTGDGVCESGIPGDPSDPIDCRFVRFFGEPAFSPNFTPTRTKVPLCYPFSHNKCVVYSVTNDPLPPFPYSNGVQYKISWNNVFSAPVGYVNSPRMYDDPSNDRDLADYPTIADSTGNGNVFPYALTQPNDNQFVFDVTTFFNPSPNTVGTDPTSGGRGITFNDWTIAWPLTVAQVQQPINSDGSSVFNAKRGVVPVKFTLSVDGAETCTLPPATISLTRVSGGSPGIVDEGTFVMAADNGSNFRISGCQYIYNLAAKSLGVGTYAVTISIDSKVVGSAFFGLK